MAKKDTKIVDLPVADLKKKITELRAELDKTVMNVLQKKEKNVKKPGVLKKEIARLLTALRMKELSL